MALNFLGLGFSLGAQDKGLGTAIKSSTAGFMNMNKAVVGIGLNAAKWAFKMPDIKPAIGLANSLANDIKLTTTGMEAYGVAASKATSAGLAGLNMTSKEFGKAKGMIAGVAFGMNADVGELTKSFSALKQSGVDVTKIGFSGFKEYSKFLSVTGADATQFAGAIGTMNKQMGMSPDEIKDSVTAVAAIGKKFNIGKEAVAGMAGTVKLLNENANRLPQNWSPARMNQFLKGTTVVAGALTSIGLTADESMAASQGLTTALLKGNTGMADLYSGLKSDLPQAFDVLTQNFGNAGQAMEMLQKSPDQFMLQMGDMVDKVNQMKLKPEAMNRFRAQMEGTFGPEMMAVFNKKGFGQLKPALMSAGDAMKDQGTVVKDLASKYEDGRTYSERFSIAQDQVQTRLKKIKGVMSDSSYLKTYVAQGYKFSDWMGSTAKKGGPLGKFTNAIVEVKNRGFGGFLASHSKFGFAMAESIQMMQPMMQYLPAMTGAFKALSSPIGLVVGGLTALYFLFKDLGKGKDSVIGPMFKKVVAEAPAFLSKIGDFAKGIFKTMYDVLSKVDWDSVFKAVTGAVYSIFTSIMDILKKINWGLVAKFIGNAFKKIFGVIFDVIDKIDWKKVGQVLGTFLSKAFEIAIDLVGAAFRLGEKILRWLDGINWGAVGHKLGGYFADIGTLIVGAIGKAFSALPEMIGKAFDHAIALVVGILDGIKDWLMNKFPQAARPIYIFFEYLKIGAQVIGAGFKFLFQAIGEVFKWLWDRLKDVVGFIGDVIDTVGGAVEAVVDFGSSLFSSSVSVENMWKTMKSGGQEAFDAFDKGIKSVTESSRTMYDVISETVAKGNAISLEATVKNNEKMIKAAIETHRIVAGDFEAVMGEQLKAGETLALFAERASHQMAQAFTANSDAMLAKLPEGAKASRDAMKTAFDELADLQSKEIESLIAGGKVTGDELTKQVREIQGKYTQFQKEYTDAATHYSKNIAEGTEKGFIEAARIIKEKQDVLLDATKKKNAEAAGEIQKTFGVTGDAALESVNQIAAVDPKKFARNMAVVKKSFMGFLSEMDNRGKKLLENTTKSINKLWETMDKGWKDNENIMKAFGEGADKFLDKFWKSVVDKSAIAATQLIAISKNIETSMKAMARTINLMDLLASPDQITAWAASVVAALSHAFMGGGAADSMIRASYDKAVMMAGEISKAGAATPDTAAASASPATSSAAMQATLNLVRAIDNPDWANNPEKPIPATLAKMNQNLVEALNAMRGIAETRATTTGRGGAGRVNPRRPG